MIQSPQIDYIKDMMIDGELKTSAYNYGYSRIEQNRRAEYNNNMRVLHNDYTKKHIMRRDEYEAKKSEYYKEFVKNVREDAIELSNKIQESTRDEIKGMIPSENL
jgi:ferredoxin-NADP reductase